MRLLLTGLVYSILSLLTISNAQVVTSTPYLPDAEESVVFYFNADQGSQGLKDYTGDIYAHTGVITSKSSSGSDWKYVLADWDENIPACKLERIETNQYKLEISPSIVSFYGVPDGETIEKLAFVFRNEDGSKTGKDTGDADIYIAVDDNRLSLTFVEPTSNPAIAQVGESVRFRAIPSVGGFMVAKINGEQVYSTGGSEMQFNYTFTEMGTYTVEGTLTASGLTTTDEITVNVVAGVEEKTLPDGMVDGINYDAEDDSKVTLVLYAPYKNIVFYLGEQNNFTMNDAYKMYKDGDRWWITLENLEAGKEYAYQYLVDGNLTIADPYAEKILDPWNDSYIPESVYPNLKAYPEGLAEGIVSVFQTAQQAYSWQVSDFDMPDVEDLVIYELHIRDFVESHSIKAVEAKLEYLRQLGVNAIELMPFNEFEGNSSWGYNPSFYFATDKYYGTKLAYQQFIDKAHEMGMAVIMDIVLNHSFGQSPLALLYMDNWTITDENPWYNVTSPNPVYSWGYDFNHEAQATKDFVDRVVNFWIHEFKVDGYRYDFTKGFTNTSGDGGAYDASRIAILKRIYDVQMAANPNSLMICEHFTDNSEEQELSDYGMLIWGNLNYSYSEASMGYTSSSDLSWGSYKNRGYTKPHLVTYSESHDEERMMYRNLNYGSSSGSYDITNLETALDRTKLSALFLFAIPGPKMLWQFQELGYDYSINTCSDGSVPDNDDCRTAEKPLRWDYAEETNRQAVYNTFSQLAEIKQNYPIFSTSDYTIDVGAKAIKQVSLTLGEQRAIAVGNFGVTTQTVQVDFNKKGWWYEYFSGDSMLIEYVGVQNFSYAAGAYELYSNQKFESHNWPLSEKSPEAIEHALKVYPNPANNLVYVENAGGDGIVRIYSQLGQLVLEQQVQGMQLTLNISSLNKGLYLLRYEGSGTDETIKLIIH